MLTDFDVKKYCLEKAIEAGAEARSVNSIAQSFYWFLTGATDPAAIDKELDIPEPLQGQSKKKSAPDRFEREPDLSGQSEDTTGHIGVSGSCTTTDDEKPEARNRVEDSQRIQDRTPRNRSSAPAPSTDSKGSPERRRDLTEQESVLLDRLAAFGPDVKVKSNGLIKDMDISARTAGITLNSLMKRGYVKKMQEKPFALWCALKDSQGNEPVKTIMSGGDAVEVTKCPPAYASGYGFKKSSIEEAAGW